MFTVVSYDEKSFEGSCHSIFFVKSDKYAKSYFFSTKFVFALKHISITNQEMMQDI